MTFARILQADGYSGATGRLWSGHNINPHWLLGSMPAAKSLKPPKGQAARQKANSQSRPKSDIGLSPYHKLYVIERRSKI